MDPFWTTWKPLTNRVLALAWFVCLTSFLSGSGLVASEQLSGADLMDMVRARYSDERLVGVSEFDVIISRPDIPFDDGSFERMTDLWREKLTSEMGDPDSSVSAENIRERLENLEEDLVKSLAARESRWRHTYTSDGKRARLDRERVSPPFRLMSGNRYRPPEQHWLFDGDSQWHVQTATDAMRHIIDTSYSDVVTLTVNQRPLAVPREVGFWLKPPIGTPPLSDYEPVAVRRTGPSDNLLELRLEARRDRRMTLTVAPEKDFAIVRAEATEDGRPEWRWEGSDWREGPDGLWRPEQVEFQRRRVTDLTVFRTLREGIDLDVPLERVVVRRTSHSDRVLPDAFEITFRTGTLFLDQRFGSEAAVWYVADEPVSMEETEALAEEALQKRLSTDRAYEDMMTDLRETDVTTPLDGPEPAAAPEDARTAEREVAGPSPGAPTEAATPLAALFGSTPFRVAACAALVVAGLYAFVRWRTA